MNHESANNGSRQSTISIVTSLKVVKRTKLGLTPRKVTRSFYCTKHANRLRSPYSLLFNGGWVKGPGIETDKNLPTSKMKVEWYIPPFPLCFVQGEIYINLLLLKDLAGLLIRGYIKGRNLCVVLDLQITLRCAASAINQVLVLFITQINANQ
jgi:hypothetical protein